MKIGLQIPVFSDDGPAIRDFVVAAEEHGFDSVWTGDHFVIPAKMDAPYPYAWRFDSGLTDLFPVRTFLEAVSLCGFIAGATSRIEIGVGIFVLPMRNPVAFANELATLDVLSGGRLIAGIGSGWLIEEFDALGMAHDHRGARTDEYLDVMRTLWQPAQPVSYDGQYISFPPVYCEPTPCRDGGVPIWVGGHTDAALRRCAKYGDGWHAIDLSPAEFAEHNASLDAILAALGRAPEEVERSVAVRLRLSAGSIDEAVQLVDAFDAAGCDHLVVNSTASRSVAENIDRAIRLGVALPRLDKEIVR